MQCNTSRIKEGAPLRMWAATRGEDANLIAALPDTQTLRLASPGASRQPRQAQALAASLTLAHPQLNNPGRCAKITGRIGAHQYTQ